MRMICDYCVMDFNEIFLGVEPDGRLDFIASWVSIDGKSENIIAWCNGSETKKSECKSFIEKAGLNGYFYIRDLEKIGFTIRKSWNNCESVPYYYLR